jgi:transcriptional regulator with XRE-family HTH domain
MSVGKLNFGAVIRKAREAKDISLRDLARRIEVSPTFLSKVETEGWLPKEDKLRKIAATLEINGDELVALAGRVPSDLTDIIKKHGAQQELASLLRITKAYSADEMNKLVQLAKKPGKMK